MTALITGYKGFIGNNLLRELNKRKYDVIGIEATDVLNLLEEKDLITFKKIIEKSDIIFHVGAISDTSLQNYQDMLLYNYHFTKVLVDLAKEYETPVIYSSSASVYGDGGSGDVPNNIYAWSKMLGEEYGRLVYPEGFTSLRYFNVYGPGESHKNKMASVAYQAYKHKQNSDNPFMLFPKEPKRDFVYVKDVVEANLRALYCDTGIYEVGTGNARSFEDVLDNMGVSYEHTTEDKIPFWYQFFTESESKNWLPNWEPSYQLEDGCKDYLENLNEENFITR